MGGGRVPSVDVCTLAKKPQHTQFNIGTAPGGELQIDLPSTDKEDECLCLLHGAGMDMGVGGEGVGWEAYLCMWWCDSGL